MAPASFRSRRPSLARRFASGTLVMLVIFGIRISQFNHQQRVSNEQLARDLSTNPFGGTSHPFTDGLTGTGPARDAAVRAWDSASHESVLVTRSEALLADLNGPFVAKTYHADCAQLADVAHQFSAEPSSGEMLLDLQNVTASIALAAAGRQCQPDPAGGDALRLQQGKSLRHEALQAVLDVHQLLYVAGVLTAPPAAT